MITWATIPRTGWATIPRELAGDQPENWRVPMLNGRDRPTLVRQTGLDLLRRVELQNGPAEIPCLGGSVWQGTFLGYAIDTLQAIHGGEENQRTSHEGVRDGAREV